MLEGGYDLDALAEATCVDTGTAGRHSCEARDTATAWAGTNCGAGGHAPTTRSFGLVFAACDGIPRCQESSCEPQATPERTPGTEAAYLCLFLAPLLLCLLLVEALRCREGGVSSHRTLTAPASTVMTRLTQRLKGSLTVFGLIEAEHLPGRPGRGHG